MKMPIRKWRSGRGTLPIIAIILVGSGLVRLGSGTSQAIAKGLALHSPELETNPEPVACEAGDEIGFVLTALMTREEKLKKRERSVGEQAQTIAFAKQEIRENMALLLKAEQALAATMALAETVAEDDLIRLTSVYENMKPDDAATLFEEMAPDFAAGFVGRMRPDAAAQIMSNLPPQTAYSISVILAGRNALAPTE